MDSYFSKQTNSSKFVGKVVGVGLLIFAVTFFAALFAQLGKARTMDMGASLDVVIGPLGLLHIHKTAAESGGFYLEFGVKAGIAVLLLISFMLGALLVYTLASRSAKRQPDA